VYAHPLFWSCDDARYDCLVVRMSALLRWNGARPLRLVLLAPDPNRPRDDRRMTFDVVRRVVRAAGGQPVDEFSAWTPRGTDGMLVLRVLPPPETAGADLR
jgi:hypothetical protein